MHALVVDDSKAVRSILAKMLGELHYDVDEACDGQEAITKIRQGLVTDLVTLNWVMPHVNGLEFLEAFRADAKFRSVPILVVSGDSNPATKDLAMAAGANAFLPKPVSRSVLQENLSRLGMSPKQQEKANSLKKTVPRPVGLPVETARSGASSPASPDRRAQTTPAAISNPAPLSPTESAAIRQSLSKPIGVMIVDDSVVVRGVVSRIIESDPDLHMVASAPDGRIAMEKLATCDVDAVLLDIEMPNMNGIETLQAIRKLHPRLPVIMFSSLTSRGAKATLDAMLLGASDYVFKPGGSYMSDAAAGKAAIEQEIIPKIKQFGQSVSKFGSKESGPVVLAEGERGEAMQRLTQSRPSRTAQVVAIGVSTGGPKALAELLPEFVPRCPVPILVVQHMPANFTQYLADRLNSGYGLPVGEAENKQLLKPGHVYLAPGGRHMSVKSYGGQRRIAVHDDPPENACRPSVDVLFRSVAKTYGDDSLVVMLTGMGSDGLRGCELVHRAGGRVIVQDEASSVVWGMPGNVYRAGIADKILPLSEIATEILMSVRLGSRK